MEIIQCKFDDLLATPYRANPIGFMMPSKICMFKTYLSARGVPDMALGIIFVVNALCLQMSRMPVTPLRFSRS